MKKCVFLILLTLLICTKTHSQSKIKKAETSLQKKETVSKSINSNHSNRESNNKSRGSFVSDVIGGLFIDIFAFSVYSIAIESPFESGNPASYAYLSKYPYNHSKKGSFTYDWDSSLPLFRNSLTARYISENTRLKGAQVNLDIQFLKRLGLEANYLQLWENNPNFGYDNLAMYSLLAKYHRIRTEKLSAFWGIGTTYIDGHVERFGFTYGLGAELFFAKPLSLEANFNQTLMNNQTVNKFNTMLNYHIKQYTVIGGYEHLRIGNQNFSTVTLGLGVFF